MHELSIAHSILEAARAEASRHPGARLMKVGVRVGQLAGVDVAALAFGFQALVGGTEWEGLALDIQNKPREHRCADCGTSFRVIDYNVACPGCGSARTECISGDELDLAYVELEAPCNV